ncbi:MAG: hypothetical protein EBR40_11550 [Proteobacteria bacterium]|nr:hypothetical protein [Pseudomonadota bacterium]
MGNSGITSEVTQHAASDVETESRPKGVYKTCWGNTWWSMIQHNKQRIYLGTFASPEAAADAYRLAKERLTHSSASP